MPSYPFFLSTLGCPGQDPKAARLIPSGPRGEAPSPKHGNPARLEPLASAPKEACAARRAAQEGQSMGLKDESFDIRIKFGSVKIYWNLVS